jgi:hypothetical protein
MRFIPELKKTKIIGTPAKVLRNENFGGIKTILISSDFAICFLVFFYIYKKTKANIKLIDLVWIPQSIDRN